MQGDTALTPDQGTTYGSLSIQIGGMQIRQAAAAARRALVDEAAQQAWRANSEISGSTTASSAAAAKALTYAELIGGKSFSLKLDPKTPAPTKDPKDFTLVGKSVPRLDIPGKATGRFTYMQDFRCPACCMAAWCARRQSAPTSNRR